MCLSRDSSRSPAHRYLESRESEAPLLPIVSMSDGELGHRRPMVGASSGPTLILKPGVRLFS